MPEPDAIDQQRSPGCCRWNFTQSSVMPSRTGEGVCTGCGAAVAVVAGWVDAIVRVREGAPEVRVVGVPGRPIQYHASETMPLQSLKTDGFHFANSAMLKLPNMCRQRSFGTIAHNPMGTRKECCPQSVSSSGERVAGGHRQSMRQCNTRCRARGPRNCHPGPDSTP